MSDDINTQNEQPSYYFATGITEDAEPSVEVVKSWESGQQSLTIGTYESLEAAFEVERELIQAREQDGLQSAMNRTEHMAVDNGKLDPARADGRMFTDGPQDTFTTERESELSSMRYTYDIVEQPTGTFELQSLKTWKDENGLGMQAIALGEYDRPGDARLEQEMLRGVRDFQGLEEEMRTVEQIAVENGTLLSDRVDPRLFTEGPPDPFTTTREAELEASMGYTFRAGPATNPDEPDVYTLDLVSVERSGTDYSFTTTEFVRSAPEHAGFVAEASDKFNHMIAEEGTGPAVQAATTWSRALGSEPSTEWRTVDAEILDQRVPDDIRQQSLSQDLDADTEPLPAQEPNLDI